MLNSFGQVGAAVILGASIIISSIIFWDGFSYESKLLHCTQKFEKLTEMKEFDIFYACLERVR